MSTSSSTTKIVAIYTPLSPPLAVLCAASLTFPFRHTTIASKGGEEQPRPSLHPVLYRPRESAASARYPEQTPLAAQPHGYCRGAGLLHDACPLAPFGRPHGCQRHAGRRCSIGHANRLHRSHPAHTSRIGSASSDRLLGPSAGRVVGSYSAGVGGVPVATRSAVRKVLPAPGVLSTESVPSIACIRSRAIASPSPKPPEARLREASVR